MNKRFSTLLAAALVAGGVSASAQTKAVDAATDLLNTVKSGDYVTLNVGTGSAFTSFTVFRRLLLLMMKTVRQNGVSMVH